jgi:hypothetical protein
VNRYNDSVIVITVHFNTQKYFKAENSQRNQRLSLCNDSVIVATIYETYNDLVNRYNIFAQSIQRLFFLNRYTDSQIVITVQAENSFFSCFRRSILKWSPLSLNHYSRELTSHIQSERDNSRDWNIQLAKFLFKLNLASLYSLNLILRDLLVNVFLSCSAQPFLSCSAHLFECVVTHFFCVRDQVLQV